MIDRDAEPAPHLYRNPYKRIDLAAKRKPAEEKPAEEKPAEPAPSIDWSKIDFSFFGGLPTC